MDFLKKFTATSETKTETKDQSAPSEQSDLLSSAKIVADAARSTYQNEPEKKHDNAEVAGAGADLLDAAKTYGKLDTTTGVGSYVEKAENYLHDYETNNSTKPKRSEKPTTESAEPPTEEPKPSSDDIPKADEPSESAKPTSEEPELSSKKEEEEEEEEEEAKPVTEEPKLPSEDTFPNHIKEEEEPIESAKPTIDEPKPSIDKEEEPIESAKPKESSENPTGLADYAKTAEGFLKKNSEGDSAEGEKGQDGIGQYAKLAEGFLNKPSEGSNASADESSNVGGDISKLAGGFLGKN